MRKTARIRIFSGCVAYAAILMLGSVALADSPADNSQILAGPPIPVLPTTQPAGSFTGDHRGGREALLALLGGLDLTTGQRSQIDGFAIAFHKKEVAFKSANATEIKNLQTQITTARQAGDKETARPLIQQLKALYDKGPNRKDLIEQIRNVLTMDQQTAFDAKVQEMAEQAKSKFRQHMGKQMGMKNSTTQKGMQGSSNSMSSPSGGSTTQPATNNGNAPGKLDL